MVAGNWKTVPLKAGLLDEVERIIQVDALKREGITNMSQFVDAAVKEKIDKFERKRFNHINMYEDHVKILDNDLEKIGRIVSVYFKDGQKAYCDYCNEHICVHIQFAWELPDVRKILEERDLVPPLSR